MVHFLFIVLVLKGLTQKFQLVEMLILQVYFYFQFVNLLLILHFKHFKPHLVKYLAIETELFPAPILHFRLKFLFPLRLFQRVLVKLLLFYLYHFELLSIDFSCHRSSLPLFMLELSNLLLVESLHVVIE